MLFGRPEGLARLIFAVVGVGVIATLGVTLASLNKQLEDQERANQETLRASEAIVDVNDQVTTRLEQLTALTGTADEALQEAQALEPLLVELRDAVEPAAATIASGRGGAEISEERLTRIEGIVADIEGRTDALVTEAQAFGAQGRELEAIVRGLVDDVEASLEAARRINEQLPERPVSGS